MSNIARSGSPQEHFIAFTFRDLPLLNLWLEAALQQGARPNLLDSPVAHR